MAQTRSKTANMRTRKQIYRSRVKTSHCRGKVSGKCLRARGCKNTKAGRRRSYCRKGSNRKA